MPAAVAAYTLRAACAGGSGFVAAGSEDECEALLWLPAGGVCDTDRESTSPIAWSRTATAAPAATGSNARRATARRRLTSRRRASLRVAGVRPIQGAQGS